MKLLIGNAFPLTLIRRKVEVIPHTIEYFRKIISSKNTEVFSFWGHKNTMLTASLISGVDLTPKMERPAVELTDDFLPTLVGEVFYECWILSPDYIAGLRPMIGEEVSNDKIVGWHVLKIKWIGCNKHN